MRVERGILHFFWVLELLDISRLILGFVWTQLLLMEPMLCNGIHINFGVSMGTDASSSP